MKLGHNMLSELDIGITVEELIKKLSKFDPKMKVGIQVYEHDVTYLCSEYCEERIITEYKEGILSRIPKIKSKFSLNNPENFEKILVLNALRSL